MGQDAVGQGHPGGELYLRRLLEGVLDRLDPAFADEYALQIAGDALGSVGLVTALLVDDLRADLHLAQALRDTVNHGLPGGSVRYRPTGSETTDTPSPVSPRAVATGPAHFDWNGAVMVVSSITAGADGATVHLWGIEDEGAPTRMQGAPTRAFPVLPRIGTPPSSRPPPSRPRRYGLESTDWIGYAPFASPTAPGAGTATRHPGPRIPWDAHNQLRVTDDAGGVYQLGAGGGRRSHGRWTSHRRLQPDPPAGVRWFDVSVGDGNAIQLPVWPARPVLTARLHGRSPGSRWVLGRLSEAIASVDSSGRLRRSHTAGAGVRALVAVGAIDPADPIVHQASLVDALVDAVADEIDPAIDARWRSPLERRESPSMGEAVFAVATTVDLGDHKVRLDDLAVDAAGAEIHGGGSWDGGSQPLVISAFDDRDNWYAVANPESSAGQDGPVEMTWRLWPALDPDATSLRLNLTTIDREASVEVGLR